MQGSTISVYDLLTACMMVAWELLLFIAWDLLGMRSTKEGCHTLVTASMCFQMRGRYWEMRDLGSRSAISSIGLNRSSTAIVRCLRFISHMLRRSSFGLAGTDVTRNVMSRYFTATRVEGQNMKLIISAPFRLQIRQIPCPDSNILTCGPAPEARKEIPSSFRQTP